VPLAVLPERWEKLPRRREISEHQRKLYTRRLFRFADFVQQIDSKIVDLTAVNKTIVDNFLRAEEARGISSKTYNDMVKLLRAAWNKLLPGFPNPLANISLRTENTCFRKPYSEEQLLRILNAARGEFINPIIIVGICTAMREGDCCRLKWGDVDLKGGFISVKTAKTGVRVEIPIWPLLREVLIERQIGEAGAYVFPEQAAMYCKNSTGITWRVQKVLRQAGIFDDVDTTDRGEAGQRLRHSSGYDFHSFRVTWITMALSQGIPIELVRRVTGHSTVEVVLKHYFRPDRENFRRVLESKMPAFLSGGPGKNSLERIKKIRDLSQQWEALIDGLTAENFPEERERLKGMLTCMLETI
jgi:integrase